MNSQRQELNNLSWTDIAAYFSLRGEQPNQWELELISTLDAQFLQIMNEKD